MFNNLRYLNFNINGTDYHRLTFGVSPPNVLSSILLELHVIVDSFEDCLYLLDGRFPQLHTFHMKISEISSNTLTINNKVNYF